PRRQLRRVPRPDQQDGRGLSRQTAQHDLLPGLPSQCRRGPARTREDHRPGLEVERRSEDRGRNAETTRRKTRSRLEGPIAAKLFRLSPMSKTIPPPCPEHETGPKYWRSLDQLADTPEFRRWVEREFPAGASVLTDQVKRRHLMKIMSASLLLAGLGF